MHVSLQVVDATGKPLLGVVRLSLLQNNALVASTVASTTSSGTVGLTAGPVLARGCYTVKVASVTVPGYAWNGVSPTQSDCVTTLPLQLESLVLRPQGNHMHVALAVRDDAGNPVEATVGLTLKLGTSPVATASVASDIGGALAVTPAAALERGCYSLAVSSVNAAGYSWNGVYAERQLLREDADAAGRRPGAQPARGTHARRAARLRPLRAAAGGPRRAFALRRLRRSSRAPRRGAAPTAWSGLTPGASLARGCYRVVVQRVNAAGYLWNGLSPAGRLRTHAARARRRRLLRTPPGPPPRRARRRRHVGPATPAHVSFAVFRGPVLFAATEGATLPTVCSASPRTRNSSWAVTACASTR